MLTLLALTVVAPGSAQLVPGSTTSSHRPLRHPRSDEIRLRIARIALRAWLVLAVLGAMLIGLAFISRDFVLGLFTHQSIIRPLAVLLIALGIVWPLLALDAWRIGQAPELTKRSRRWIALLTAVIMVVTFGVPIALGRRVWAAADLLSGVFGSGKNSAAVAGRYNVLLLGGDAGPDRVGTRPDSINLASIDEKTGQTALFSLPRNLQNVSFPAGTAAAKALPHGWNCGDVCLLNAIYTWGSQNPKYFPGVSDPGAEAMMEAVQGVTGLKVNYYVLIDLQGFRDLIDAVGGIHVDVTERTPIGGETSPISGWIEPGEQRLNGFHALWYARSRTASSDYSRMARQRCVMTAMVNQLDPATVLKNFQSIASASSKVVATDIPAAKLPAFLELAGKAKSSQIESVQFVPPVIVPKHPDFSVIRAQVKNTIAHLGDGSAEKNAVPSTAAPTVGTGTAAGTPSTGAAAKTNTTATNGTGDGGTTSGTDSSKSSAVDVRSVCKAA